MVRSGQPGARAWRAADGGGDIACPGPPGSQAKPQAAAAADDPPGAAEDPQSQSFWFPPAGRSLQGEHLCPGEQFAGQRDDLAPDLVLGVAVQGRFRSPVSLALRMRSSQRARRRCRSSRSAS